MPGAVNLKLSDRLEGWLRNEPGQRATVCLSSVHEEWVAEIDISRCSSGLDDRAFGGVAEPFGQVDKRHALLAVRGKDASYIEMGPHTDPCRCLLCSDIGEEKQQEQRPSS